MMGHFLTNILKLKRTFANMRAGIRQGNQFFPDVLE